MKASKVSSGLIAIFTVLAINSIVTNVSAQQEFILTTTNANIISNRASIDMPGLSGNALAIIVATPLGDTETLNPNPIGVWYYAEKWNINNTNNAVMPPGAKYKIQIFLKPGANQFLHVVTKENLGSEGSYIDHPTLNNNPNAQVQILQNHAPDVRSPYNVNRFAAKAAYSSAAKKWYIANLNGEPLGRGSTYNIVVGSGGIIGINPTSDNPSDPQPTSLPPSGNAGGDLSGTYPNPTVQKLVGRPLSNVAPAVGQILRWNGTAWEPASETVGGNNTGGTTYNAGSGLSLNGNTFSAQNTTAIWNANQLAGRDVAPTTPSVGQVLKWNGSAWMPADANAASPQPTSPVAKASVVYFNQSNMVNMYSPNDPPKPVTGLDNQTFTLPQSSRIVHHTVIDAKTFGSFQANATGITVTVEILDASNVVRSRAVAFDWLTFDTPKTILLAGVGVLPAGTYRTKVSVIKQSGGASLDIRMGWPPPNPNQGGQMIIEIFPD